MHKYDEAPDGYCTLYARPALKSTIVVWSCINEILSSFEVKVSVSVAVVVDIVGRCRSDVNLCDRNTSLRHNSSRLDSVAVQIIWVEK